MPGFSTRWYFGETGFFTNERWTSALKLSVIVAVAATILATCLGTLAALGLSRSNIPGRATIMAVLISPMIVPVIISAIGLFFFYAYTGLNGTLIGIILAHTALATPFVVITVTATLMSFDRTLMRAGASLGGAPHTVFFKVVLPLILPGVISGALFAFVTSFDEGSSSCLSAARARSCRANFSGFANRSPTITAAAACSSGSHLPLLTLTAARRRAVARNSSLSAA